MLFFANVPIVPIRSVIERGLIAMKKLNALYYQIFIMYIILKKKKKYINSNKTSEIVMRIIVFFLYVILVPPLSVQNKSSSAV